MCSLIYTPIFLCSSVFVFKFVYVHTSRDHFYFYSNTGQDTRILLCLYYFTLQQFANHLHFHTTYSIPWMVCEKYSGSWNTIIQTFYWAYGVFIYIHTSLQKKQVLIEIGDMEPDSLDHDQKLCPLLNPACLRKPPPRKLPRQEPLELRSRVGVRCPRVGWPRVEWPRVGCPRVVAVQPLVAGPLADFWGPESLRASAAEQRLTQPARSWLGSCRGFFAPGNNLAGWVYLASGSLMSLSMQSAITRYAALEGWTWLGPHRAAVFAASSSEGSSLRCPMSIIFLGHNTLKLLIFLTNNASLMKSRSALTAIPSLGRNPGVW